MSEFNAIHQHGIFYDCIYSELIPLPEISHSIGFEKKIDKINSKKCISKYEYSVKSSTMRMAIEEGDPVAVELLHHRFLRKLSFFSFNNF